MKKAKYTFSAKVWKYQGKAGWYFVTLPKQLSKEIRSNRGLAEEGWGRLKTSAQLGDSKWNTSIWYDTKAKGYLLPIKSEIRKREKVELDTLVSVRLHFEADKNFGIVKGLLKGF